MQAAAAYPARLTVLWKCPLDRTRFQRRFGTDAQRAAKMGRQDSKQTFRDGTYYRHVFLGKRTVKEGECAAIWTPSGDRKL